jgi:hypothetical protein
MDLAVHLEVLWEDQAPLDLRISVWVVMVKPDHFMENKPMVRPQVLLLDLRLEVRLVVKPELRLVGEFLK